MNQTANCNSITTKILTTTMRQKMLHFNLNNSNRQQQMIVYETRIIILLYRKRMRLVRAKIIIKLLMESNRVSVKILIIVKLQH